MQIDSVIWCASVTKLYFSFFNWQWVWATISYVAIKSVEATFVQGVSTNHTLFNITVGDKKMIKNVNKNQ